MGHLIRDSVCFTLEGGTEFFVRDLPIAVIICPLHNIFYLLLSVALSKNLLQILLRNITGVIAVEPVESFGDPILSDIAINFDCSRKKLNPTSYIKIAVRKTVAWKQLG